MGPLMDTEGPEHDWRAEKATFAKTHVDWVGGGLTGANPSPNRGAAAHVQRTRGLRWGWRKEAGWMEDSSDVSGNGPGRLPLLPGSQVEDFLSRSGPRQEDRVRAQVVGGGTEPQAHCPLCRHQESEVAVREEQ